MVKESENDRRIDYIEFPVRNIEKTKAFYGPLFGWSFMDYEPEYGEFGDGRLAGGLRDEQVRARRWTEAA